MQTNQHFLYNLYRPIFIAMLICGYNFDFIKNLISKITFNIYATSLVTVISYSHMTCCPAQEISFIWSLLEYAVFVIIMLFYKSKVRIFLRRLIALDTYLRLNRRHYFGMRKKISIGISFIWMSGVAYMLAICFSHDCYVTVPTFLIYEFSLLALDVNRVWRYYIFEEIWRRLKLLRLRMEENPDEDFYLYVKNNKTVKENKVRFCMGLYKSIADLLELISPELDASLLVSILCAVPKLVINVYRILLVIDNILPLESLGFMVMNIFQTWTFVFTPCIVVELYGYEVERIRKFLIHKLITEKDKEAKKDLQLFLQYTTIRSFEYKVCRVVPMDLSLPLNIINLCTTYVIVIVNFTKVFQD